MAAFVLPVVPPRTGGGGGTAASSSPPRRRRHHPRPLPVVAVVVPVVRAAVFEPDPPAGGGGVAGDRGTTGSGGGGDACHRGPGAGAVKREVRGRGLAASETETETVSTSQLSATTFGSSTQPNPQLETGTGGGAAQTAALTTEDFGEVTSGDGDAVTNASNPVTDDDSATDEEEDDPKGAGLGRFGRKHTAKARAKISAANRGRVPWNKGRQHSEETRARIAAATRAAMNRPDVRSRMADKSGRKHTPETRAKIRASCTARYLASRKAMNAGAMTAGDGSKDGGSCGDSPAAVPASDKAPAPIAPVRTTSTRLHQAGNSQQLPFSYDNAVLGPQVLAALPPPLRREDGSYAASYGAWATSGGSDNSVEGTNGGSAGLVSKRGPLSAETRAKLSRRIRDMWANDPGYRARVTAGIAAKSSGKVRQLSMEHREAIRQSLLSRNADLRKRGVAHPSTRYADGQARPRRRRRSGSAAAASAPPRTPEEQAARAEARRLKRQDREVRRAARRAAREEEDAARRQSQKALVSQLVSAGSLPSLESLAQLDSWSGEPFEMGGDAHGALDTSGDGRDAPDFDAIRAAGVSLQGRLRGASDGGGEQRGDHDRGCDELASSTGVTAADGSGVPGLNGAGVAPAGMRGGDARLPPAVVSQRIDYGDQLSFDLVSLPTTSGAAGVLGATAGNGADNLAPVAAAESTDTEDEDVESDSDDESDYDDWDDDDDSDDDDIDDEDDEGFDFSWEYEVEPGRRKPATPISDAPVRKRILTYVNGAATMVDSSA